MRKETFDRWSSASALLELAMAVRGVLSHYAATRGEFGSTKHSAGLAEWQATIDEAERVIRECDAEHAADIDGPPAEDAWLYDAMRAALKAEPSFEDYVKRLVAEAKVSVTWEK